MSDSVGFVCAADGGSVKCVILAPTTMLTPQEQRIKTDAWDALIIVQCLSYGGYHAVYISTEENDSVKKYQRMRNDHKTALKKIKQQINALCLRHGYHYDSTKWTIKHVAWLRKLEPSSLYRKTPDKYLASYDEKAAKIKRFDKRIEDLAAQESYEERVKKLGYFLGIRPHTALSLLVETGGFSRYVKGNTYAAFLGLAYCELLNQGSFQMLSVKNVSIVREKKFVFKFTS